MFFFYLRSPRDRDSPFTSVAEHNSTASQGLLEVLGGGRTVRLGLRSHSLIVDWVRPQTPLKCEQHSIPRGGCEKHDQPCMCRRQGLEWTLLTTLNVWVIPPPPHVHTSHIRASPSMRGLMCRACLLCVDFHLTRFERPRWHRKARTCARSVRQLCCQHTAVVPVPVG